jgi:two-component system, NarL family, response regulator LiaR
MRFLDKDRSVFIFGSVLAILLFLLKWIEYRFLLITHMFEIYVGLIALIFTLLGVWLARKIFDEKVKTVLVEKEVIVHQGPEFQRDEKELDKIGLSLREVEVLELMAQGYSNQEIAEKLFVTLSTVKTHGSNILEKLDVKRRTQAVDKAKKLRLIA